MRGEGREEKEGREEGRGGEGAGGEGGEGKGEETFLVMLPRRLSALNPPLVDTSRDEEFTDQKTG